MKPSATQTACRQSRAAVQINGIGNEVRFLLNFLGVMSLAALVPLATPLYFAKQYWLQSEGLIG